MTKAVVMALNNATPRIFPALPNTHIRINPNTPINSNCDLYIFQWNLFQQLSEQTIIEWGSSSGSGPLHSQHFSVSIIGELQFSHNMSCLGFLIQRNKNRKVSASKNVSLVFMKGALRPLYLKL